MEQHIGRLWIRATSMPPPIYNDVMGNEREGTLPFPNMREIADLLIEQVQQIIADHKEQNRKRGLVGSIDPYPVRTTVVLADGRTVRLKMQTGWHNAGYKTCITYDCYVQTEQTP